VTARRQPTVVAAGRVPCNAIYISIYTYIWYIYIHIDTHIYHLSVGVAGCFPSIASAIYTYINMIYVYTHIYTYISPLWGQRGVPPATPPLYIRTYIWCNYYTHVYTHTYKLFVGAVGGFSSSASAIYTHIYRVYLYTRMYTYISPFRGGRRVVL